MLMARPLLKEAGIGSILLENPFYGSRKPKYQTRSSLHNVSDIFVMGGCLILESLALFHWCEREGYGPLGISGISMGGHMASLAGCSWHKPIPIIPCLSWTTASCVFTQGVMSAAIPWPLLENQYSSDNVYQDEIRRMLHSPEEREAFLAGIHFSRTYPSSLKHMQRLEAERNENTMHIDSERKVHNSKSPAFPEDIVNKFFPPSFLGTVGINNSGHKSKSAASSSDFKTDSSHHKEASSSPRKDASSSKLEAQSFMRGVMDECTHLGNFSTPVDPSLSIVVTAKHDAYIPRDGIKSLSDLWPGCEVRYIDAGHIAAFLFNQGVFRKAVTDAFEKTAQKYYGSSIITDEVKPALEQDANR